MLYKSYKGLSSSEVKKQFIKYGYNEVLEKRETIWKILYRQINSPLIYLLILSAIISFYTGDYSGGIIITVILLINTFLGFFQEYKSNKMFESLEKFITSNVTVIRDNKEIDIDKKFLVPNDIVIYKLGDIVSADCYVLEQNDLKVDESSLTGESDAIYKENYDQNTKSSKNENILFSGSTIKEGVVIAKVFAIGKSSKFGKISTLTLETSKKSEYVQNIYNLSKGFTVVSIISLIFILGAHLIFDQHTSFTQLLLFTLAIAITIIPEALPVISTLALTRGALKISKHHVIIKELSAIQDLGNVDIICTDKTGTLTKNELKLKKYISEKHEKFFYYSTLISLNSTDVFDKEIYKHSRHHVEKNLDKDVDFKDIPFNPVHRYSAREFDDFTIYKGSPETIIANYCLEDEKEKVLDEIEKMSSQGYRDLSIAVEYKNKEKEYLGTYFFEDEIKEETYKAIELGRKQNIHFKIITGDSFNVALSVGKKVKLIENNDEVIEASKLSFSNPEILFEEVNKFTIFARSNPEQKYKIIQALETQYHVGYLGDGINDAPSLKVANVGMVVDTATDIAKSSADIILLSKNLESIVNGIVEGRKVFVNLDKYLKHTLSSNFGNLYTVGIISLFLNFLPMLPIQILLNNLLSDIPCLALATDNTDHSELKKPKHHNLKNLIIFSIVLGIVSSAFDIIFFIWASGREFTYIQTMSFVFATLTELFVIFSMRTNKFFLKGSKPSKLLVSMALLSMAITLILIGIGSKWFDLVSIKLMDLFILMIIVLVYFVTSEAVKVLLYKKVLHKNL